MNPHAIAKYASCKTGRKGTILCDMDGKVVLVVNNKIFVCVEDWKEPVNYDQFLATISKVHKNHSRCGEFIPPCDNCFKNVFTDGLTTSCTNQCYNPNLLNNVNPRNVMVTEYSLKKLINAHYEVKSYATLLPVELK